MEISLHDLGQLLSRDKDTISKYRKVFNEEFKRTSQYAKQIKKIGDNCDFESLYRDFLSAKAKSIARQVM